MNTELNVLYSLNNITNYKTCIDIDLSSIISKYSNLIIEYLQFVSDNNFISDINNYVFYIMRGYDIIHNVFNLILYYTHNVDMAYYHGQQSYVLYIEFINQSVGGQNVFLQLTSREAVMFVYKKTINEVNNDIRQNMVISNITTQILDRIRFHGKIMKVIISYFLSNLINNKQKEIYFINRMLYSIKQQMNILTNNITNQIYSDICCKYVMLLNETLELSKNQDANIEMYNTRIISFFKEVTKQPLNNLPNILEKILNIQIIENIKNMNSNELIEWIFSMDCK